MANPKQVQVSFESILDQPAESFDRPPPIPNGTYAAVVQGPPEEIESKTGTPGLRFVFKLMHPFEDVDANELEKYGGLGDNTTLRRDFYVTQKSGFFLRDFLEKCGVDITGKTLLEASNEAANKEVGINVKQNLTNTGNMRTEIVGYVSIE